MSAEQNKPNMFRGVEITYVPYTDADADAKGEWYYVDKETFDRLEKAGIIEKQTSQDIYPIPKRENRLAYFVKKYKDESNAMTFMGEPISDLSREQLLAVLCDITHRYTDMLNSPTKG